MALQNKTLRLLCKGDMRVLVKAVNKDPAMMDWLDTVRNSKFVPNENYAREVQELFTLGVNDFNGEPNYTQADIVQIARAFFSAGGSTSTTTSLSSARGTGHDFMANFPARGPKVLYASTGGFAGAQSFANPEGETEIDQVIDIIFEHRDSDGKNTGRTPDDEAAPRILLPRRLGGRSTRRRRRSSTSSSRRRASTSTSTCRRSSAAIFTHDAFYATQAEAPFGASLPRSVKWPVDFVVSTLRMTGVKGKGAISSSRAAASARSTRTSRAWADPPRSAERLRLGLGAGVDLQRDAPGALQLRPRRHHGARRRRALQAREARPARDRRQPATGRGPGERGDARARPGAASSPPPSSTFSSTTWAARARCSTS
jgi:hypothetical protein